MDKRLLLDRIKETTAYRKGIMIYPTIDKLPQCLRVTAQTADGEIMAVEHREYPVYGLQFHPESILTPEGETIMTNFMEVISND